jgi:hypothetical protein
VSPSPFLVDILFPGEPAMTNDETAPTLADLARAADVASRAYDVAADAFGKFPNSETEKAWKDTFQARSRTQAALDKATRAEDDRMRDAIAAQATRGAA